MEQMQAQHTELSRDAAERGRKLEMQQFQVVEVSRNASAEQQKMYQEEIGMLTAQMERANERAAQAAQAQDSDAANALAAVRLDVPDVWCADMPVQADELWPPPSPHKKQTQQSFVEK